MSVNRWLAASLVFLLCGLTWAQVITDDFDTPHDYLVDGVAGTIWDGILIGPDEDNPGDINEITTQGEDPNYPEGTLCIRTTFCHYNHQGTDAPLLYIDNVEGNFVATVKVPAMSWLRWNEAGIVARVPDVNDAGPGEDYVWARVRSKGAPPYPEMRYLDDGKKYDKGGSTPADWIRLTRKGNDFIMSTSVDGVEFMDTYTLTRDDMAGLPVQVGLVQAGYSGNNNWACFDDFSLAPLVPVIVSPADGAMDVPMDVNLVYTDIDPTMRDEVYLSLGEPLEDPNGLIAGTGAVSEADGVYSIAGVGGDLWNKEDQFTFVYTEVTGSCVITARVDGWSGENIDNVGLMGVQVRSGLGAGDLHATCAVAAGGDAGNPLNQALFRNRFMQDNKTGQEWKTAQGIKAPAWVKLVRLGNLFLASAAPATAVDPNDPNIVTDIPLEEAAWVDLESEYRYDDPNGVQQRERHLTMIDIPDMSGTALVGLMVCAHEWDQGKTVLHANISEVVINDAPATLTKIANVGLENIAAVVGPGNAPPTDPMLEPLTTYNWIVVEGEADSGVASFTTMAAVDPNDG